MSIRDENGFELFSHNPHTGRTTWRFFDGQRWIFRTDYDADEILAGNKAAQAEFAGRRHTEGLGDPVASVPLNVFYETLQPMLEQGDKKAVSRWLNSSDNAQWRQKEGRV